MAIDILTLALAKKMSGSSGGSAIQSDWNQNDETASDYVKNRTHWEEVTTKTVGVTREFSATSADGGYIEDLEFAKLLWEHRKDAAYVVNGADGVYSRDVPIGNIKYRWGVYANNREIWVWLNVDENEEFTGKIQMGDNGLGAFDEGTITIEVEETETTIHTIDPKYIKDMYYAEPKIITETRSGVAESADGWKFVDPEFAALLRENFKTAEYVANGKNVSYKSHRVNDDGAISISTTDYWGVVIHPDGRIGFGDLGQGNFGSGSITITYESEEIHTLDPKYLPDSAKSDWNQNDASQSSYVKNRPFYSEFEEHTVELIYGSLEGFPSFAPGDTVTVTVDGVEHSLVAFALEDGVLVGDNPNEPPKLGWFIVYHDGTKIDFIPTANPNRRIVSWKVETAIHKLDTKYLPILEESTQTVFETVVELNEENGNEVVLEEPTLKKLVGKYVVTIDGVSETVTFIDELDGSFMEGDDYFIGTQDGGIYIRHDVAGTHSVKIDKINDVIKEEHLPDSVKAQPDWNANEGEPGYIKNRPFYGNIETIEVNETCNVGAYYSGDGKAIELGNLLKSDNDLSNVVVTIKGTEYALVYNDDRGWWDLKDGGYYSVEIDSTGTYIFATNLPDGAVSGTATFTGYYKTGEIKQLDPKYIKDMYYTEGGLVEILPETTLTTTENNLGKFYIEENPPVLVAGNTYIVNWNGTEYTCTAQDLTALMAGAVGLGDVYTYTEGEVGTAATGEPFVILYVPGTALFAGDIDAGATSVTIAIYGNGEIVHKLDNKYLDLDWLPVKTEQDVTVLEEDMQFTGTDQSNTKISPEIEDGKTYTVLFDGETYTCVGYNKVNDVDGTPTTVILLGNTSLESDVLTALGVVVTDTNEPFLYVYLAQGDTVALDKFKVYSSTAYVNSTRPLKITGLATAHNKLPEEYLPDSVESVIIRSSTAGSTKKFKLTVDDNGTIAATEVT